MIQQLKTLLGLKKGNPRSDLDVLLASISAKQSLPESLENLVKLLNWIRYEGQQDSHLERETGKIPTTRIRFLLMILDRNPLWKIELARLLRKIVRHISAMEFFTETGIAKEYGFLGEVMDRMMMKILPQQSLDEDLATLFAAMFPDKRDHLWIKSIDALTFKRIIDIFNFEVDSAETGWNRLNNEMEDALTYLVIQCRAIGLAPQILKRLEHDHFRSSPFYDLTPGLEAFFSGFSSGDRFQFAERAGEFKKIVHRCRSEVAGVHKHLEEFGVSVNIVYQLARLEAYLKRIESLTSCMSLDPVEHQYVLSFLSDLTQDNQEIRSLKTLLSQNVSLLSRKVVERSAETGEHYITRTKEEYRHMILAASGGGMLTALTVYIKVFVTSLGITGFIYGFLATINYSLSFVAIHLAGFTLGTKQPAMTGPALAAKMRNVMSESGMSDLVTEVEHLIRSQVASILGNVIAVVPTVLAIDLLILFFFDHHIVGEATAQYTLHSTDIFGGTVVFAAFTGVLLWLSSLTAGWADNWFALRGLRKALAHNPRLNMAFGKVAARRLAHFLENNMSGIVGSISLGSMLGLVPEILKFLNIPLEVRHVTLSSGALAASIPALGWNIIYDPLFWRAVIGIFFTGVLNISVAFGFALLVAWRAIELPWFQKKAIYKAVLRQFVRHPLSFFFPVGESVRQAEAEPKKH